MLHAAGFPGKIGTMSDAALPRFALLVPVKPTARAKSRLAPLGDEARRALVAAFAADTVAAALDSSMVEVVLVVTDDHRLAAVLGGLGAHVMPDGAVDDLNASLVQAAAEAHRRWPNLRPAAICADLPALEPAELDVALEVAAGHPAAFTADTDGVGTTMVAAATRDDFTPLFGPGSREAHLVEGAHEIVEVAVPTLRRDVDTPTDLAEALTLGVGPRTTIAASGIRV
jgi:2-phospho-L-lactate guanylyltransferase